MSDKQAFKVEDKVIIIFAPCKGDEGIIVRIRDDTEYKYKVRTIIGENRYIYRWFKAEQLKLNEEENKVSTEQIDNVEKALGIKKDEEFNIKGWRDNPYIFSGNNIIDKYGNYIHGNEVIYLIDHPERIEKLPQKITLPSIFWQQLKVWQSMGGVCIRRIDVEQVRAYDNEVWIGAIKGDYENIFELDTEYRIDEILSSEKYTEGE